MSGSHAIAAAALRCKSVVDAQQLIDDEMSRWFAQETIMTNGEGKRREAIEAIHSARRSADGR
jgi:hypothetical protein